MKLKDSNYFLLAPVQKRLSVELDKYEINSPQGKKIISELIKVTWIEICFQIKLFNSLTGDDLKTEFLVANSKFFCNIDV